MKAVILAAGIGSRLGNLIKHTPKPMIRLKDKPILENNILLCKQAGINEILINLYYIPEVITEYFNDGSEFGVKISYFLEDKILGTAGALLPMEKELGKSPFFILYGDNFIEINLESIIEFHNKKQSDFTIVTHKREDVSGSGVIVLDGDMAVIDFVEKPKSNFPASKWVNAGIYLISSIDIIESIIGYNDDFGLDIIPQLIKGKYRVFGYKFHEILLAVDTPDLLRDSLTSASKVN